MNHQSLYNGFKFLTLGYIGHIPSHIIRKMFYRLYGMKIGKNSYIYSGAEIRSPNKIRIGNNVIVGHRVILDGRNGILIEDNVNIIIGVWIWTMQHDPQPAKFIEQINNNLKFQLGENGATPFI
jgi:acetyltransferase-like isoleucine patch superfamily enzyme